VVATVEAPVGTLTQRIIPRSPEPQE